MMGQSSVVMPRRVSTEGMGGYWDVNDRAPGMGVWEWGAVPKERAVIVSKKFRASCRNLFVGLGLVCGRAWMTPNAPLR